MEDSMQTERNQKRGWLRTTVFTAAGVFYFLEYLKTHQIAMLITAAGFAMILPNTFLHPVNWLSPTKAGGVKPHPALTLLTLVGGISIIVGLVMQWL